MVYKSQSHIDLIKNLGARHFLADRTAQKELQLFFNDLKFSLKEVQKYMIPCMCSFIMLECMNITKRIFFRWFKEIWIFLKIKLGCSKSVLSQHTFYSFFSKSYRKHTFCCFYAVFPQMIYLSRINKWIVIKCSGFDGNQVKLKHTKTTRYPFDQGKMCVTSFNNAAFTVLS